jgi:LemA protein
LRLGLIGCLGALILVLLIGGIWFIGVRNHLVTLDQAVQAQWAQVENDYQRRYDLIPNLVKTVQGAANFEKSTLEAVVNARSRVGQVQMPGGPPGAQSDVPNNPQAMAQFEQAQGALSNALSRLLVVVERYPDLKSNQNFLELQSQLEGTENRIAVERRRYNEVAQQFNSSVLKFPANIVASMSGFKPKAYFKGAAGSNVAPEVNFQPFGNQPAPPTAPATATATTGTR